MGIMSSRNTLSKLESEGKVTLTGEKIEYLKEAIRKGFVEKAKKLIRAMDNVNIDINYNLSGFIITGTFLLLCCHFKNESLVSYFIEFGADIHKIESTSNSPLMVAVDKRSIETMKVLIDAGADGNFINENSHSALSKAVYIDFVEGVELLLSLSSIDISLCGDNSLVSATFRGNSQMLKRLIESGANLNCRDSFGWTCLHHACNDSKFEIIELLMANGADENITNNQGKTAVEITRDKKIIEFINNFNCGNYVLK